MKEVETKEERRQNDLDREGLAWPAKRRCLSCPPWPSFYKAGADLTEEQVVKNPTKQSSTEGRHQVRRLRELAAREAQSKPMQNLNAAMTKLDSMLAPYNFLTLNAA